MAVENELLEELRDLRDRLRRDNAKRGREPVICSDSALEQMAEHPPQKESDLLAVEGFGESAVDRYGAEFLRVTRRFAVSAAGGQGIDAETARALRELQKRLVNLSRSNRLLFMPRTGAGTSFDIGARFGKEVIEFIYCRKEALVLSKDGAPGDASAFRRLNSIIREVNRDLREHGTYDLYIGYPFAEGLLPGEEGFPIRAPLALFPVTIDKRNEAMTIRYDEDRDAVFNTTLILATMKALGIKGNPGDAVIEENVPLAEQINRFFGNVGLTFEIPGGVAPFKEYRSGEFPEYGPGTFDVVPSFVLGKFPSYSSLVERDIDMLINGREVNENLRDLLRGLYSGDFRSEYPLPLSAADLAAKGIVPREPELLCVNSLDGAQEAALAAMDNEDGLVIQGPPGTGKSQVITAMIAAAAASGKTVLMVSEKKTALDVVRSRLGELSKYCIQVDDTADKEGFFAQLRTVLSLDTAGSPPDLTAISASIEEEIAKLGSFSDNVFGPGSFGISPADLFSIVQDMDTSSPFLANYGRVSASLMHLSSEEIDRMIGRFSEGRLLRNLRAYSAAVSKMPWAEFLKPGLTEKDLGAMVTDLGEIYQENASVSKKGFFSKFLARNTLSKHASSMAAKYLVDYSKSDVEDLVSDPEGAAEFLEEYDIFQTYAENYRSLSSGERSWWRGMGSVSRAGHMEYPEAARALRDVLIREHLREFDERYPSLREEIPGYDSEVERIDKLMARKRDLARGYADAVLSSYLSEITSSKRYPDILRISEQKRKWSIAKFMGRYGYELFRGIRIWLMTPEAVSETVPLEMGTFDLLVFDEASQMFTERGVPSIYRASKTVVAGDHRQLRPSALGRGRLSYDDEEDTPEQGSLLDLARSRYDSVLLNYHYRSEHSALIAFSDRAFYGGRLYVSPDTDAVDEPPIRVVHSDGVWEDRMNTAEADTVVSVLRDVLSTRENNESVGIIAFNVHQMECIADKLEEACAADHAFCKLIAAEESRKDNGEDTGLFIKNVESVQGDERDVIIFSIGYARDAEGKFVQRFGWLNAEGGENRLNVAITRAKKRVIIVQSFEPEDLKIDRKSGSGPRLLRDYLEYARAVSSGDTDAAMAVLDRLSPAGTKKDSEQKPFIGQLREALADAGYDTESDVGSGGCKLDIAIRKEGRFVIGIEDDCRVYSAGGTVRERDYHRRKFLESRGWKVIRTWTPAVQRNPEEEIRRILGEVSSLMAKS